MKADRISKGPVSVLIGTRKGAYILRGDKSRRTWKLSDIMFLGQIIHHLVVDPRDGKTILAAARTGHLGPTMYRSTDFGKTWKESERPPAFPKVPEGRTGLVLNHVFWLTPGHASQPGVWYAGSSPQGLFRTEDGGRTWEGVAGFNEHPMRNTGRGQILGIRVDGEQALFFGLVDARVVFDRPARRAEHRPAQSEAHVYRHVQRRRIRNYGWRLGLETAEQGLRGGLSAGPGSGVWARPSLGVPAPADAGSALSTEPLRHLSDGAAGRRVDPHRKQHA